MLQFVGLPRHSVGPVQVAVTQAVHPDAAGEVQIILALRAVGVHPVAPLDDDGVALISVQDVVVVPHDDFFSIHFDASLALLFAL